MFNVMTTDVKKYDGLIASWRLQRELVIEAQFSRYHGALAAFIALRE